ncbi:MAG: Fic family protein [Pseudonocardiaceae bacterium]
MHAKAAALLHSLVTNHALVDGNKRLAPRRCFHQYPPHRHRRRRGHRAAHRRVSPPGFR